MYYAYRSRSLIAACDSGGDGSKCGACLDTMSGTDAPVNETPNSTESSFFPAFAGSFVLESSEGIRFHTHRYLLEHVSGFFRDMFSLPSKDSEVITNLDSATLNDFLCLVDPLKLNPIMKASTLPHLIEAARCYRMPFFITWFEDSAIRGSTNPSGSEAYDSFVRQHPLWVLSLGHQSGLRKCVHAAMLELATCRGDKLMEDVDVSFRLYRHALSLRDEQVQTCSELTFKLSQHNTDWAGRKMDEDLPTCTDCTVGRGSFIGWITRVAFTHPDWKALEPIIHDFPVCKGTNRCPSHLWVARMRTDIAGEKSKIMFPEKYLKIPIIPAWLEEEIKSNAQIRSEWCS